MSEYGTLLPHLDTEIALRYTLARKAFLAGDITIAHEQYRTLRAEHGIELYYEVDIPVPMKFVHPLGTVLGRATYAPNLVVYQGVSVGSTLDKQRPTFTGPCVLFSHSAVIGYVFVGKNVYITPGTIIQGYADAINIPDNCVVYNHGDGLTFKPTRRSVIADYFTPTS